MKVMMAPRDFSRLRSHKLKTRMITSMARMPATTMVSLTSHAQRNRASLLRPSPKLKWKMRMTMRMMMTSLKRALARRSALRAWSTSHDQERLRATKLKMTHLRDRVCLIWLTMRRLTRMRSSM